MRVKLLRLDVKNLNNRIYRREFIEESVRDYNNRISEGDHGYGEIGFQSGIEIPIDKSSHIVSNLEFEGDFLMGDVEILSTSEGDILNGLIEEGSEIIFRPLLYIGEVNDNNEVVVNRIVSFNVVNPSEDSFHGMMDELEVEEISGGVVLSIFRDRFTEDKMMVPISDYMTDQMSIVDTLLGGISDNKLSSEEISNILEEVECHKSIYDNCLKFIAFKSLERSKFLDLMENFIESLLEREEYEMVEYYTNILNEYESSV